MLLAQDVLYAGNRLTASYGWRTCTGIVDVVYPATHKLCVYIILVAT